MWVPVKPWLDPKSFKGQLHRPIDVHPTWILFSPERGKAWQGRSFCWKGMLAFLNMPRGFNKDVDIYCMSLTGFRKTTGSIGLICSSLWSYTKLTTCPFNINLPVKHSPPGCHISLGPWPSTGGCSECGRKSSTFEPDLMGAAPLWNHNKLGYIVSPITGGFIVDIYLYVYKVVPPFDS